MNMIYGLGRINYITSVLTSVTISWHLELLVTLYHIVKSLGGDLCDRTVLLEHISGFLREFHRTEAPAVLCGSPGSENYAFHHLAI